MAADRAARITAIAGLDRHQAHGAARPRRTPRRWRPPPRRCRASTNGSSPHSGRRAAAVGEEPEPVEHRTVAATARCRRRTPHPSRAALPQRDRPRMHREVIGEMTATTERGEHRSHSDSNHGGRGDADCPASDERELDPRPSPLTREWGRVSAPGTSSSPASRRS